MDHSLTPPPPPLQASSGDLCIVRAPEKPLEIDNMCVSSSSPSVHLCGVTRGEHETYTPPSLFDWQQTAAAAAIRDDLEMVFCVNHF